MFDIPHELRGADFALVRFQLEFQESCRVTRETLLSLRRDLQQAARLTLAPNGTSDARERFSTLFDPPLPADPVALRRHQRPGAPFAIIHEEGSAGVYESGDLLDLKVVFWGGGIPSIADFARSLRALGRLGLHRGEGAFELAAVHSEDTAGNALRIWREGEAFEDLAPAVTSALWWLEAVPADGACLELEFVSPARLLSRGKPLFRPSFTVLFPFILRRVTSMLYAHCGVEIATEPQTLLQNAVRVVTSLDRLRWEDWRMLAGGDKSQDLGGILGLLRLEGEALAEIFWVLSVGSFLNVGKNAAYGAGCYRIRWVG